MKVVLLCTPRSGSHARCSQFENPLYESLSVMDLLLPRDDNGNLITQQYSTEFNYALATFNWSDAYDLKPELVAGEHIVDHDEKMQLVKRYEYPSKQEFLTTIDSRLDRLEQLDTWCVKVMRYHGLSNQHILRLLNISDNAIKLQRRDKLKQSISQYLANHHNVWHNAQATVQDIDYEKFSAMVNMVTEEDQWINSIALDVEFEYYEDVDFTASAWKKNQVDFEYDNSICKKIIDRYASKESTPMNIREQFEEKLLQKDWSDCYSVVSDTGYLKGITTGMDYWEPHMHALETIDIGHLSKDIAWLDMGTWFGVMPYVMREIGFTNIETTDCYNHRTSLDSEFQELWKQLNLQPQELEVLPMQPFDLGKKYDLITVMKSNLYWKTQDVIMYDGDSLSRQWQNLGDDGKHRTYFTVYNQQEWDHFFMMLRRHLNPGGCAIVNPEPWVYDSFDTHADTKAWLKRFEEHKRSQQQIDKLTNYLVIRP